MSVSEFLSQASSIVWGAPTILLLFGGAIYIMIRLRFMPLRRLGTGFREMVQGATGCGRGEIPPLQCLTTALSATVGTGNIAGVATAIALGGPGAIFWMWLIALFGTALKYSEAVLAVRYRRVTSEGEYHGGPMYYIQNGLGKNWQWMAVLFALFTLVSAFGIGNMVQSNSVADALQAEFQINETSTGVLLAVLAGVVILGGLKRIGAVAVRLVPLMVILYVLCSLYIILANLPAVPDAFATIFSSAFSGHAATGGFVGATVVMAIQIGAARGLFSNEAGLGSAAIAHAAADTTSPVRQGQIAMVGPIIDTLIICTMTALVIIISGMWSTDLQGVAIATAAYSAGIPAGGTIISVALAVFAFTTVLGWCVYGERALRFLVGSWATLPFRILWIVFLFVGATIELQTVWTIADIFNGLMVWPNMIALLLLSTVVASATLEYEGKGSGEPESGDETPAIQKSESREA